MALFAYQAFGDGQRLERGTVTADSPRQARELLRGRGLRVRAIQEQRGAARRVLRGFGRRGVSGYQLASVSRDLGAMLRVGIPLAEALATLAEEQPRRFKVALQLVRDRIAAGEGLAEAMSAQPDVFDEMTRDLAEVGERTGTLASVLTRLADYKERSLEVKDRVVGALIYPAIIAGTALLVAVALMTLVVPTLLETLIEAGRPLPWPTRLLKLASDLVTTYGWWLAGAGAGAAAAVGLLLRTRAGRRGWHRLLLRLPLLGPLVMKQSISRIAMVLSTLLENGVVFVKAQQVAAKSARNLIIEEALLSATQRIAAGVEIDHALSETGLFSPTVVRIFSVGQEVGELDRILKQLADDYDKQVNAAAARATALVEPVLILGLAAVVGFILFATLLPILEAGSVL